MNQSTSSPRSADQALPIGPLVGTGLMMGVASDLLLREAGPPGINLFLFFIALGAAVSVTTRKAGLVLSLESAAALAVGPLFAAGIAFRAAPFLHFLAFLAAAAAFAFPALRAGGPWILRCGVRDLIESIVGAAAYSGLGAIRLTLEHFTRTPPTPTGGSRRRRLQAILRGLVMAIPFLLVFGALFMSADRVFARLVTDFLTVDLEELVSHIVLIGVFAWLSSGFLTGVVTGTRVRWPRDAWSLRPSIGMLEAAIPLALVDLLFAGFVVVQLRYLFGGSDLVEVTPGLTYAEYAREGFAQLAIAAALVLPSLLALDWLLRRDRPRDEWVFRTLGGVQIVLLFVIIASALQRVRAYQDAYGLTESRFYGAVFLLWLILMSLWFAVTVLGGRRHLFAFPGLASAYALVALLFLLNPDARIARVNLQRTVAITSDTVDVAYLGSLSADAVPTLIRALPTLSSESRCVLAERLLERWDPESSVTWRIWNWSTSRARASVATEAEELRSIAVEEGCE